MNRTLLAIASPRNGTMVSMQKVARTISAARYPTKSIQDIGLSFAAAAQMKKSSALGPEALGPGAWLRRLNGCVGFCRPSPSLRLQAVLWVRWPSAGSGSQVQIWSAHRRYRRPAHPRPNFAPRGGLPPSARAVTCASWETPSVQGRVFLLTDLPKVRRFTEVSSRASSFLMVRGTSRVRFDASYAPTRKSH